MKRNLTILSLFLFIFTVLLGCTSENLTSLTEYIPRPTNYNKHIKVKVIPRQNKETGETPSIEETREKAITIFEKRLNTKGKKNVLIKTDGEDQIIISISENIDLEKVKELITNIGILNFKEQDTKTNEWKTVLTGDSLKPNSAKIGFDSNGMPYISIEFTSDGAKLFNEITKRNIKKPIGIYFDEKEISSPIVQVPISNGQCQISGYNMSIAECEKIVILLNSGSLNADIQILETKTDNNKEKKQ